MTSALSRRRRYQRFVRRGFTLVELVVALTAGIAVAGAAYVLSKSSLNAFEAEARMSQAQFGATMGLNRLVADVERAAFMSNPNAMSATSGRMCGNTAGLNAIRSVWIDKQGGTLGNAILRPKAPTAVSVTNGIKPDNIYITGNFGSNEQFEFSSIQGTVVYVTVHDGAMQRTLIGNGKGGPSPADLFLPNRYVRLIDGGGKEAYAHVASIACTGGANTACDGPAFTQMTITLDAAPQTNGMVCGDWLSGGLINPVNIVEYWVGKPVGGAGGDGISAAALGLLAPQAGAETGDTYRTELVRTELTDISGTLKPLAAANFFASDVVAEYAVDLNFAATYRTGVAPNYTGLKRLDGDLPADTGNFGVIAAEDFVGVGIRLSVRARAPDRDIGLTGNPKSRYNVFGANAAGATALFARVRTLTEEVNLPNTGGIQW